jgi:hypothetical protein
MIALEVNGSYLDLLPAQEVTLTSNSPLFDRDRIDRVFSLPFSLPATPRNILALGPFNRIDSDVAQAVPAKLYLLGSLYEQGFLRLVSPGIAQAEFVFQGGALFLRERLERLRLKDLAGRVEISAPYRPQISSSAAQTFPFPLTKMAIGINDQVFTANWGDRAALIAQINAAFPGIASDGGESTPELGLTVHTILIDPPAGPEAFFITANPFIENPEEYAFFNAFVTSTYQAEVTRIAEDWLDYISEPREAAAFPVIAAPNLYGEKNEPWLGYANYVDTNGDHPSDYTTFIDEGWEHTLLPQFRLGYVLNEIGAALGITFGGNALQDPELLALLIWSNQTIDVVRSPVDYLEGAQPFNQLHTYRDALDVADHLPDITALELLVRLVQYLLPLRLSQQQLSALGSRSA